MRLVARLMTALMAASLVLPALAVGPAFAAAADHLSVTVNPGSGVAGDSFDITVTALDPAETVDTGYTGTVTFTSSDPGASLPSDYTFVGGDSGTKTFIGGATLTTAGNRTITATDTVIGSINGTSTTVAISADVADHIVLTGSIANLASGTGRTLTATIKDQFGNTRTSDNSTVVSFDKTAGTGTVTGEGTDTASAGIATKVITGQLIGSVTITASAGVLTTDSLTFTVVVGAASQIDLTGSTGNLAAGATRVLTATITDAAGNVRTGDNSTVVTFAKAGGAGTVSGLGTDTASAGVASVTVTGALAGSIDIEATGASITSNTLTFTVIVGAASQIVLSGSTGNLASGGTRILTATITDSGGNTITSDNTTVISFDKTAGSGTVTGEGTNTVSSGVATKTLTGDLAGSVTITATGASMTSNTLTFSVVPGAAAQIVLSGSVTDLTSGATRVLTATLKDAAGNTLTNDSTTTVTFAKTGGAGTVTGLGTDTATAGVASVTVTGALAGSIDIDATGASQTSNTLTFNVVPGAATQIVLSGATTNLASGATRVLTATIEDAAGNVQTGDSTTVVTFSKTAGVGTVTGLGADTATAGVASVTVTGVLAGSIDIHATAAGPLTSNTLNFTIAAGAATQIVLSGATTNLTSGATRVLTATLKDAAGNTEIGDSSTVVTFAKTTGAGTVTGLGTDTATAGVASVTVTGEFVGSIDIDATAAGPLTSNTLTFTVVVGAASQVVLSGLTTPLTSGATRVLTATIEDAAGNVRTGDSSVVTFSKTGGAGTVTGLGADTASAGVASVTVTGVLVGSIDLDATSAGPLTSNTLTFTVVVGAPNQIVLSGLTTSLTSGATRVLTATIEDAAGNVQSGDNSTVVTFAKTAGAGTATGLTTAIATAGVAQVTVTGELVGSITIHATTAGPLTSNTLTFTVVVGAADHIVLSGLTTNLASGATRAITATIVDAAGNTRTADTDVVTFAKTAGTGTVTGTGTDAATGGIASVTVTGILVGSITFTASATGLPDSNDLTFSIVPGAPTQLILSGAATNLTSGTTRVLTATIEDAAGNVETGDNATVVTFSKTAGAGTVTGLGPDAAAAGVAQLTVTGEIVGSISLDATAAGPITSNTLTFTVVVGPANQIVLSGSAADLASGSTRTLTASIEDAAGNVESGDNTTVVTFSKTSGTGTVSGLGPDTATGGIASVIVTGVLVGSIDIHATSPDPLTSDAVTFAMVVGPLDHIVLNPQTVTVDPGVNQAYTVESFDAADNSRGDVTGATTLGIVGGTCNNATHTCQALTMGAHTVTATYLTKTDNAIQTINNLAPDAVDDSGIFVNEDAVAFPIDVLNNDSDANGDAFTITSVTQGGAGTVAIASDNLSVTYTPDANVSGVDTFTYTITDINGGTDIATVSLTVIALNDAPSFTLGTDPVVLEDAGPQTVGGFAVGLVGPPDESAQVLTYAIEDVSNPTLFSVEPAISSSGDLTFTSAPDANGSATITVHVTDDGPNGGGDVNFSAPQTFQINVTAVDDSPVAVDDGPMVAPSGPNAYLVKQGIPLVVNAAAGVLTDDSDIDTAQNLLTALVFTQGTHGTVVLNADGSFTYTPSAGVYVGVDSFTYHAFDGTSNSNIGTVNLYIYLNHAPTAVSDIFTVVSGNPYKALAVLTNDNAANPDSGEVLTITAATHPIHGTVVITGGGTGLSYRPTSGFIGSDVFSYTISDGVFTSSASVLVKVPKDTVKPVATAPVQTIGTQTSGTSTVKVHLAWTGTDQGSGISKYELWWSTDGHSYKLLKTTSASSSSATLTLNHVYRFRVRAIDKKGNIGSYAYGPSFKFVRYQETSAVFVPAWANTNSPSYSGGHARTTSTLNAEATLTTTGRTFSWIGARGSTRSTADVYVDGVLKAHLSLVYTSTQYQRVIYSITFPTSGVHAFKIVYTGASNRRIDLDAIVVLR